MLKLFTKKNYLEVLEKIKFLVKDDPEEAHIYEDWIKNRFIADRYYKEDGTIDEIVKILLEINNIEYPKWYS